MKRIFASLMTGTMAVALAVPAAQAQNAAPFLPPGDITGDLRVTVEDAIQVLRIVARERSYTSVEKAVIDVAPAKGTGGRLWGDGQITVSDAIRLLRRAVGLEPDPWPGGPPLSPANNDFRMQVTAAEGPYQWRVSEGVIVTGKMVDARNRPLPDTEIYFGNATRQLYGRAITDAQGNFAIAAQPGLYQISFRIPMTVAQTGSTIQIAIPDMGSLNVQPGLQPISLKGPNLPQLFRVEGNLTSLPATYTPVRVEFVNMERRFDISPPPTFGTAALNSTGRFTAFLPNGTYQTLIVLRHKETNAEIAMVADASLTVAANRNVTLRTPVVGSLSGTFSIQGQQGLASGRILTQTRAFAERGGGGTGVIAQNEYFLPLQSGVAYDAAFLPDALNPATLPGSQLGFVEGDVNAQGNNTRNILLPAPPEKKTVRAWIGDALGRPIPNAQLYMVSDRLYNVSLQYVQDVETAADRQGVATLSIPDGLYQITVGPPASLDSVFHVSEQ